jgi:hypothetical protein
MESVTFLPTRCRCGAVQARAARSGWAEALGYMLVTPRWCMAPRRRFAKDVDMSLCPAQRCDAPQTCLIVIQNFQGKLRSKPNIGRLRSVSSAFDAHIPIHIPVRRSGAERIAPRAVIPNERSQRLRHLIKSVLSPQTVKRTRNCESGAQRAAHAAFGERRPETPRDNLRIALSPNEGPAPGSDRRTSCKVSPAIRTLTNESVQIYCPASSGLRRSRRADARGEPRCSEELALCSCFCSAASQPFQPVLISNCSSRPLG